MAHRRRSPENPKSSSRTDPGRGARALSRGRRELRETMEAIAVAFILAFLFRTFEAEAFVIPTGSMAPTLFGRHKDVECPQCGYRFQVGASEELDRQQSEYLVGRIHTAACPNCRFAVDVRDEPVFTGDRILVNKFPYELGEPRRWDVFVFKFPEDPKVNYIKRLVGLPEDTIEIRQGDVYLRMPDGTARILRKDDPAKQRELQILVYDNDYPERALHERGWPERWAPMEPDGVTGWSPTDSGWRPEPGRRFRIQADTAAGPRHWIRYRHIVPRSDAWEELRAAVDAGREPDWRWRPQLISDFCAYNETSAERTGVFAQGHSDDEKDAYWVGDLTVTFQIDVIDAQPGGELLVELVEGDRSYRCTFDVESGTASIASRDELYRSGETWTALATAPTALHGTGSHTVSFANVDDRLSLWVDGELVPFGEAAAYPAARIHVGGIQRPGELDLVPVGIAAEGLSARVSHLLLERDIYYRADQMDLRYQYESDEGHNVFESSNPAALHHSLGDPDAWFDTYNKTRSRNVTFELGPDEFLALGDNSPASKDSRLWANVRRDVHRHAVPRSALVGKAFFIYWPHGVPFLNDGDGFPVSYHKTFDGQATDYPSFRVPFYPNVQRMRRIR